MMLFLTMNVLLTRVATLQNVLSLVNFNLVIYLRDFSNVNIKLNILKT